MKDAHSKLIREITEENKAIEKAATKTAVDAVTAFFTENPNARVCVLEINAGGNTKALQMALGHVTKQYQRAAYLFTVDKDEGKVIHMNTLPKSDVSKAFNGKEWISAISAIVGGRGGGKDDGAQGVGNEPSKVQESVAEAKNLYEKAIGSL